MVEYFRTPFGLANAPSILMRLMNMVINPPKQLNVLAYMDDILIPTPDVETGLKNLGLVFEQFRVASF